MNSSSVIENGYKTRFASEFEDMVFLLTHLCEIEPVCSRIFLEGLKKACWFSFGGKGNKEAAHAFYIWICCRSDHKTAVENQSKPNLVGLYMKSFTRERQREVSPASAGRD